MIWLRERIRCWSESNSSNRINWTIKNDDSEHADSTKSMFILTILEKTNETRLKFSQRSITVLLKMASYEEARVKLTNTQLNKLKSAAKNNTGTTLRISKKNFQDEKLPHGLFL